jgi:hypothetical protein
VTRHGLAVVLVLANLGVWCLAVPASAGAYPAPSGLDNSADSAVCPPRPADTTSTTSTDIELTTVEQELADECDRTEQQDATEQGWTEFDGIALLTIGLVVIVVGVAGVVVVLWR